MERRHVEAAQDLLTEGSSPTGPARTARERAPPFGGTACCGRRGRASDRGPHRPRSETGSHPYSSARKARTAACATACRGSCAALSKAGTARASPIAPRALAAACRTYHFGSRRDRTRAGTARRSWNLPSTSAARTRTPPDSSRRSRTMRGISLWARRRIIAMRTARRTTMFGSRRACTTCGTASGSPRRPRASTAARRSTAVSPFFERRRRAGRTCGPGIRRPGPLHSELCRTASGTRTEGRRDPACPHDGLSSDSSERFRASRRALVAWTRLTWTGRR